MFKNTSPFGSAIDLLVDFSIANEEAIGVARSSESLRYEAPDLVHAILLREESKYAIPELMHLSSVALGRGQVTVGTSQNIVDHLHHAFLLALFLPLNNFIFNALKQLLIDFYKLFSLFNGHSLVSIGIDLMPLPRRIRFDHVELGSEQEIILII